MMALLLPALPFFAYFGVLAFALLVLAVIFWPVVLPRLISILLDHRLAMIVRRRKRSMRLSKGVPR